MDVKTLKKFLRDKVVNDKAKRRIREEIRNYKDQHQDSSIMREEIFKPITKAQTETKDTIDKKQDEIIKELKTNQQAIKGAVQRLAIAAGEEEDFHDASDEPPKPVTLNFQDNLTADDIGLLKKAGYGTPNEIAQDVMRGKIRPHEVEQLLEQINARNKKVGPKIKIMGNYANKRKRNEDVSSYTTLSEFGKKPVDEVEIHLQRKKEEHTIMKKYANSIRRIKQGLANISGSGIRKHKQAKRNAYKISNSGHYGGLMVNVPRLFKNEMTIEAKIGGKLVYENKADRSTIDLLTKRFDPRKKYSSQAKRVFRAVFG